MVTPKDFVCQRAEQLVDHRRNTRVLSMHHQPQNNGSDTCASSQRSTAPMSPHTSSSGGSLLMRGAGFVVPDARLFILKCSEITPISSGVASVETKTDEKLPELWPKHTRTHTHTKIIICCLYSRRQHLDKILQMQSTLQCPRAFLHCIPYTFESRKSW